MENERKKLKRVSIEMTDVVPETGRLRTGTAAPSGLSAPQEPFFPSLAIEEECLPPVPFSKHRPQARVDLRENPSPPPEFLRISSFSPNPSSLSPLLPLADVATSRAGAPARAQASKRGRNFFLPFFFFMWPMAAGDGADISNSGPKNGIASGGF